MRDVKHFECFGEHDILELKHYKNGPNNDRNSKHHRNIENHTFIP